MIDVESRDDDRAWWRRMLRAFGRWAGQMAVLAVLWIASYLLAPHATQWAHIALLLIGGIHVGRLYGYLIGANQS